MEDGLLGKQFNRWTVIKRGEDYIYPSSKNRSIRYWCACKCGKEKLVHKSHLLNKSSQSCGCLNIEICTTHGVSKTREYSSWSNMIRRCLGKGEKDRKHYLDKNISVCSSWLNSVDNFIRDMGECPNGYELDRVDSNGNYEPANCRWVSEQLQAENRGGFSNNSSGHSGVVLVKNYLKDGTENFYWGAIINKDKKVHRRNFSIRGLGERAAFTLAVAYRKELEERRYD